LKKAAARLKKERDAISFSGIRDLSGAFNERGATSAADATAPISHQIYNNAFT